MGKHRYGKKQSPSEGGVQAQVKGFIYRLEGELEEIRDEVTGAFDAGIQGDTLIDDLRHQARGVFTKVERGLHDAVHGNAGPVEQALRKLQDCAREAQHSFREIAKNFDREGGRHLGKNIQHKMQETWHKVQDFFSKLVEKIGHFLKEVKQQGLSAVHGSHKKTHDKYQHHDVPRPEPTSQQQHKPKKPR